MTDGSTHLGPSGLKEMRGEWPGGWREDAHGNLAFAIRTSGPYKGDEAPVWACVWCRSAQLHTLAEHEQILRVAAKAGPS